MLDQKQLKTLRNALALISLLLLISCGSNPTIIEADNDSKDFELSKKYASTITSEELSKHLYVFSSDAFEGRLTGEPGQKKASEYLKKFYVDSNIQSPFGGDDYFQEISADYLNSNSRTRRFLKASENVLAFIKGREKPNEIVVISAHLDHIGKMYDGTVYNGADDDGSGNVAILEIAEAFKKASEEGNGPKRSILFLHVTGEENGLLGSKYYTENPVFPLINTVTNLNIDMIGRVDKEHKDNPNYVYLIGSDKLSSELHTVSEEVNKRHTQIDLDYTYNDDDDPNRFYYRSDHYNFAQYKVPIIFYFNGTHDDYHQVTDTPDKIDYELLEKRAKLIFHTAWEVANRKHRVFVDKAND